jgi:hypothetical protein
MLSLHQSVKRILRVGIALAVALGCVSSALAGPRDQARRMHDRLVGVPPDEPTLQAMTTLIAALQPTDAAEIAMQHRAFYGQALKNFVTPWTNVEQTVFDELNDYTATVIGMIRDDVPFDEVLSGDILYVGAPGLVSAYAQDNNDHYRELEAMRADLSDPAVLERRTQSEMPGAAVGPGDAAGVVTTRAAARSFFSAGTNRRMWRFTAMNFLCRDMEALHDVSRPADRIRQDINRSPGGDSTLYHTQCQGCHSGMDPVSGAYAYYEWDASLGRMLYTPGAVQGKYLINANTFPGGYVTIDDSWRNFWREGPNAALGWDGALPGQGSGAKTLGEEVAASRAFSICQVEKVFEHVCFRPAQIAADATEIERIADEFEQSGYRMKTVFAEVATYCMGN